MREGRCGVRVRDEGEGKRDERCGVQVRDEGQGVRDEYLVPT